MPLTSNLTDVIWIISCAVIVLMMQAGFCCLESGLVRNKNSINVAIKNFADLCVSSAVFWMFGFAIMFGADYKGLLGTTGVFFDEIGHVWLTAFFLFQAVFCGTAITIVSGAVAERMKFTGYLALTAIVAGLVYPFFGHWAWGGLESGSAHGWLRAAGFIDFAGSTVVHSIGGWVALAAIIVIGPRIGRFDPAKPRIHGHNISMSAMGIFLLWIGWFGFNGGSALAITDKIPLIFLNTFLAGVFGGVATLAACRRILGRFDVGAILTGSLAGLVGITASANIVMPWAAAAIGAIAGVVALGGILLLEKLKIDDAVGAVPVHCGAGIWGTLAVALFADPTTWETGLSRWDQLVIQATGVGTAFVWGFGVSLVILLLVDRLFPLRVSVESEEIGLNVSEHAAMNDLAELLGRMEHQRRHNDFSDKVPVEPHTEIGQIAAQYNRVIGLVNSESQKRESAVRKLRRETESLELSKAIAVEINASSTVEDVLQYTLDQVCAWTDWPVGHVYLVARTPSVELQPTNLWHLSDLEKFKSFQRITLGTHLAPGAGLPGRVWSSGEPAWIPDVTLDPNFLRARLGEDIGIKAGFAFPILVGKEVAAVLEFYSEKVDEPDEHLLQVMQHIGTQLGRVIERERAEEQLRQNAKMESLGTLAGGIAHDLNNVLVPVLGLTKLTMRQLPEGGQDRTNLGHVLEASQRAKQLVQQILDFSRAEQPERTAVAMDVMAREMLSLVRSILPSTIEIQQNIEPDIGVVLADETQIHQVLMNLAANAMHAMEAKGGALKIALARVEVDDDLIAGGVDLKPGPHARFTLRDTGCGMDEETMKRIFDPFFTTKGVGEGTGMGLAVVHGIVRRHEGAITVASEVGRGTTFELYFPLCEAESSEPDAPDMEMAAEIA